MPKILYKDIPADFDICLHEDCPRAASCLRQIAYKPLLEHNRILHLVNPIRCTKDDKCPYYRNSTPITYARGFTNMQRRMFPEQYYRFMSILQSRFGRNAYYERRKGNFALTPKEQKLVLRALRQAGVKEEMKFDRYEENLNWFD